MSAGRNVKKTRSPLQRKDRLPDAKQRVEKLLGRLRVLFGDFPGPCLRAGRSSIEPEFAFDRNRNTEGAWYDTAATNRIRSERRHAQQCAELLQYRTLLEILWQSRARKSMDFSGRA